MPLLKMDKNGRVGEVSTANHNSQEIVKGPRKVMASDNRFAEKDINAKGNNQVMAAQKREMKANVARKKRDLAHAKKLDAYRIMMKKKNIAHAIKIKKAMTHAQSNKILEGVRQGFQRSAPDSNFDDLNPVTGNALRRFDGAGPTTDFEVLIDSLPFTEYPSAKEDASSVHQFIIDGPEIIMEKKSSSIPAVGSDTPTLEMALQKQKVKQPETIGIPRGLDPLLAMFAPKRK